MKVLAETEHYRVYSRLDRNRSRRYYLAYLGMGTFRRLRINRITAEELSTPSLDETVCNKMLHAAKKAKSNRYLQDVGIR